MSEELKKQTEAISHEFMTGANTANRIGEVLSAIIDEVDEISQISRDSIKNSNDFLMEYLDEINGESILEETIAQKLRSILNSKTSMKQAIEDKGVNMKDDPQLSDYVGRIGSIESTETGEVWSPNPTWWDIKTIIQDVNNQEFTFKTIQLLQASDITTTFTGGIAYKTSDGQYYTSANVTHTWEPIKDKQCVVGGEAAYKTRWVITYHSSPAIEMNYLLYNCLYFIMDGVLPTTAKFGSSYDGPIKVLNSFEMINGADFANVTDFSNMFSSCYFLLSIPQINTSNGVDFSNMFESCNALISIPLLDTSNGTDFGGMFGGCTSLISIPPLNTSKGTDFNAMFQSCFGLTSIPSLDTKSGKYFHNMFNDCYKLTSVISLNTSNGIYFDGIFNNCICLKSISNLDLINAEYMHGPYFYAFFDHCILLESIQIANLSRDLSLSDCQLLNRESLLFLINNLSSVTISRTLTLGEVNLAKLTTAEKAIATNKGWTLQ